jgi:hypothetical protein
MIAGSRSTKLPFELGECARRPIHLFDFEFSKALKDRSTFHDGHVINRHVCDRGMAHAHTDAGTPDSQGGHRHELSRSERKKERIAEDGRWSRLSIDQLNFLPVLHQREFQLPGLFPALGSMAEGNPSMGQVVLGGVVIGRGQPSSWNRGARKCRQTKMVIDR